MYAFLEIMNGRYAGTTLRVADGDACIVGSAAGADLFLPHDGLLEPLHFIVRRDGLAVFLEKLCGNVFVNNEPADKCELMHGDFVFAGRTLLQFIIAGEVVPNETVLSRLIERLLKIKKLGLLIDASLEPSIASFLEEHRVTFRTLKKEVEVLERLTADPLLARLNGMRRPLEIIVRSYWGQGRVVFFEATSGWKQTIEYFQFLLSKTQINNSFDLRIYDPRALRVVFGNAEPTNTGYFFGAVQMYLVESQLPAHMFEFRWQSRKVKANLIKLIPTQQEESIS